MAAEAEAQRESDAKVVTAQGELDVRHLFHKFIVHIFSIGIASLLVLHLLFCSKTVSLTLISWQCFLLDLNKLLTDFKNLKPTVYFVTLDHNLLSTNICNF